MPYARPITDLELENLVTEALGQLANSIREYEEAKVAKQNNLPTAQLADIRWESAKESVRLSITVYEGLRENLEQAYLAAHPVDGAQQNIGQQG